MKATYIEKLEYKDIPSGYQNIIVFDAHNTLIDEAGDHLLEGAGDQLKSAMNSHKNLIVLATHGEYDNKMQNLLGWVPFFVFDLGNRIWLDDHKSTGDELDTKLDVYWILRKANPEATMKIIDDDIQTVNAWDKLLAV